MNYDFTLAVTIALVVMTALVLVLTYRLLKLEKRNAEINEWITGLVAECGTLAAMDSLLQNRIIRLEKQQMTDVKSIDLIIDIMTQLNSRIDKGNEYASIIAKWNKGI